MKFLAALVALTAVASAAPGKGGNQCKPGTYECATGNKGQPGWNVCNTGGLWVYGGNCPPKTKCFFNKENQSPYCI